MVLLQGRCSAQGRDVFQLHPDAVVLLPFPRDAPKHTLIPCHTVFIAASVNEGRETQRMGRPLWVM